MTSRIFPILEKEELELFREALNFLHVEELRECALQLSLLAKGNKVQLMNRIYHFVKSGEVIIEKTVPAVSCAKRKEVYPLHPDTLMLKGAYKNDLKTRLFFKELIGEYFHYTAFGIDWLNERWLKGNPPTYREFAKIWKEEYERRKNFGSTPKKEWAFINFSKNLLLQNPDSSREMIIKEWEKERKKRLKFVGDIMPRLL